MKATGIVRRIDDLGRVVVPKEIRRTLRIREGDPLLTTLTLPAKPDKQGTCEDFREEAAKLFERIKRELFVSGVIDFTERTKIENV